MIKAEVVFDGDSIDINGFTISIQNCVEGVEYWVWKGDSCTELYTIEEAIKYCLEN